MFSIHSDFSSCTILTYQKENVHKGIQSSAWRRYSYFLDNVYMFSLNITLCHKSFLNYFKILFIINFLAFFLYIYIYILAFLNYNHIISCSVVALIHLFCMHIFKALCCPCTWLDAPGQCPLLVQHLKVVCAQLSACQTVCHAHNHDKQNVQQFLPHFCGNVWNLIIFQFNLPPRPAAPFVPFHRRKLTAMDELKLFPCCLLRNMDGQLQCVIVPRPLHSRLALYCCAN